MKSYEQARASSSVSDDFSAPGDLAKSIINFTEHPSGEIIYLKGGEFGGLSPGVALSIASLSGEAAKTLIIDNNPERSGVEAACASAAVRGFSVLSSGVNSAINELGTLDGVEWDDATPENTELLEGFDGGNKMSSGLSLLIACAGLSGGVMKIMRRNEPAVSREEGQRFIEQLATARTAIDLARGVFDLSGEIEGEDPSGESVEFVDFNPNPIRMLSGLSSEIGEVLEEYDELMRKEDGKITEGARSRIIKELGDVMWFTTSLTKVLAIDVKKVAETVATNTIVNNKNQDALLNLDDTDRRVTNELVGMSLRMLLDHGRIANELKTRGHNGNEITKQGGNTIIKYSADILWCVNATASLLGSSLEEVIEINNNKIINREKNGTICDHADTE